MPALEIKSIDFQRQPLDLELYAKTPFLARGENYLHMSVENRWYCTLANPFSNTFFR